MTRRGSLRGALSLASSAMAIQVRTAAAQGLSPAAGAVSAALGLADVIDGLRDGRRAGIGIAAPARTPAQATEALVAGMRAVTANQAFCDQAASEGYHMVWEDGQGWLAEIQAEQASLAKLWQTDPWLSSSGG